MSCDVGQYLPPDDSPVPDIEHKVHLGMVVRQLRLPKARGRGGSFYPRKPLLFEVATDEGHIFHIRMGQRETGECFIVLDEGSSILRKFHQQEGHSNPGLPNNPLELLHMHFPTVNRSLTGSTLTWAYDNFGDNFIDADDFLSLFCTELAIERPDYQGEL